MLLLNSSDVSAASEFNQRMETETVKADIIALLEIEIVSQTVPQVRKHDSARLYKRLRN